MARNNEEKAQMLLQSIEQLGREKNIAPELIVEAIEEAMAVAAQKFFRTDDYLRASLDRESGKVSVNAVKTVVDEVEDPTCEISVEEAREQGMEDPKVGDELSKSMPTDQLGRIAAQAAKQVIYQKVRDAERDNIHSEYVERVGELLTGIVKRFERGDMIVDLGRTEGILPRREQSRVEHYNIGDRIRIVIIEVLRSARGPQVVVSRCSPELLRRLFEMEVPEIYDETVVIKGVVREGGDRAKVAVHSKDADVDPVGACVGMRGSRVQAIIRELRGEKIDIVEWSPELFQFTINALKPARVNRVTEITVVSLDGEEEMRLEVLVDEDQLSLAIGKRGQNVRLAGKLLGRKIDVTGPAPSPEAAAVIPEVEEPATESGNLEALLGISAKAATALREAGFATAAGIVASGEDALLAVAGIGPKTALKVFDAARRAVERAAEGGGQAAAEPEPATEPEEAAEATGEGSEQATEITGADGV